MELRDDVVAALQRTRLDLAIHLLREDGGFQEVRASLLRNSRRRGNRAIEVLLTVPNYRDILAFGEIKEASVAIFRALNRAIRTLRDLPRRITIAVCDVAQYCEISNLPIFQVALRIADALRMAGIPDASDLAAYLVTSDTLLAGLCGCDRVNSPC